MRTPVPYARCFARQMGLMALAGVLVGGCNLTKLAANQTVDVMKAGKPSIDYESDLGLARTTAESNIGLMQGLRETVPDNDKLQRLLAESYTSYAFGFVDLDLDRLDEDDPKREAIAARLVGLYTRGRTTGIKWLMSEHELPHLVDADDAAFERALEQVPAESVDVLFWIGNAWGNLVNLQQEDPMVILEIPRVEAIMNRVIALDEGFFDGGAHLFFGTLMTSIPAALSDQTAAAAVHFDRAVQLSEGKNLLVKALKARWLLVATRDRAGFVETLNAVLDAPSDLSPSRNLVNALARARARLWLSRVDRYFPGGT